jgi:hypothetical protein
MPRRRGRSQSARLPVRYILLGFPNLVALRHQRSNVLADTSSTTRTTKRPRSGARPPSGRGFVTVTVLLEFEGVMRGFYRLSTAKVSQIMSALSAIEHIILDNRAESQIEVTCSCCLIVSLRFKH